MSKFTKILCLYVCKKHFTQALLKIQFGNAISEILPARGPCNYCNGEAISRLFVYKNHWLVNEFIKDMVLENLSVEDIQVKNAMRDIEYSYQRISELQSLLTSDNDETALQAKSLIDFLESRIKVNQNALEKVGIMKFIKKPKVINNI